MNQNIQLDDAGLRQFQKVWNDLIELDNWDDVYEWTEYDYYTRFGTTLVVAMCLYQTVQLVVFGRTIGYVRGDCTDTVSVETRQYFNGQG